MDNPIGVHFEQLEDGSWRAHAPEVPGLEGLGMTRQDAHDDLHKNRNPAVLTIDVKADVGMDHAGITIAGTF